MGLMGGLGSIGWRCSRGWREMIEDGDGMGMEWGWNGGFERQIVTESPFQQHGSLECGLEIK